MTEEEFKKKAKTIPIDVEKEEAEAINYFKYKVLPTTNGTAFESKEEHYTKMVLNVIEKLKKENEELRQNYDIATTKIEELRKKLSLKCFDVNVVYNDYLEKLREFKSNSIPKYKIREKLNQEYEEYTNLMKAQQSVETKNIWTYQHNAIKGILEELLGEE